MDKMTAASAQSFQPQDNDQSVIDLRDWTSALLRHLKLALAVFIGVFALVALLLLSQPKAYTATARVQAILHERNAADVLPDSPTGDSALTDASKLETEIQLLESPTLARDVMNNLGAAPPAKPPSAMKVFITGILQPIKDLFPQKPKVEDEIEAFTKPLKVDRTGQSYVMTISYTSDDPEFAAKVANLYVDRYQARKANSSIATSDQVNAWLTKTLKQLEEETVAADEAVAQYRAAHNLVQAGTSTMDEQTVSVIGQQLVLQRAAQAEADARFRTAQSQVAAGGGGDDVGEALASPVVIQLRQQRAQASQDLTTLRARYGARHPDVIKATQALADIDQQIQTEINRILSNLKAQAEIAHQRTASMEGSLGRAQGALTAGESASVKLSELTRKQEAARAAYNDYLNRFKRTSAADNLPQNETRVIAPASVPLLPSAPNLPKSLAMSFAAAFIFAVGSVFGAELLQQGFSSSDALERKLGVRVLPSIPTLASTVKGRKNWPSPIDYVVGKPLSAFAEAFRTLRSSTMSSLPEAEIKVVVITSALPGEGKTTTSVCFGRVAAIGGAPTVIVDCDLRRRSLANVIGKRPESGLLEVLDGKAKLDDVLVKDAGSGAYILPLSSHMEAHRDVFGSPEMDELLNELRRRFELIILDSAPVLALADTRVLAQKADVTVLLARWKKTPRAAVEDAVRELLDVGATLAGVALTQVDLSKQTGTTYGQGRAYAKYYGGYFTE